MDTRQTLFQPRRVSYAKKIKEEFNAEVPSGCQPEVLYKALCREQQFVATMLYHGHPNGINLFGDNQALTLQHHLASCLPGSILSKHQFVSKSPLNLTHGFINNVVEQDFMQQIYNRYTTLFVLLITSSATQDINQYFYLLNKNSKLSIQDVQKARELALMLETLFEMGAISSLRVMFNRMSPELRLKYLAIDGGMYFCFAVLHGQPEIVDLLIDVGVDPNAYYPSKVSHCDSLLTIALRLLGNDIENTSQTFKGLVGLDINLQPELMQRALQQLHTRLDLMLDSYEEIFISLLRHGADPDLACGVESTKELNLAFAFYPDASSPRKLAEVYQQRLSKLPGILPIENEKLSSLLSLVSTAKPKPQVDNAQRIDMRI